MKAKRTWLSGSVELAALVLFSLVQPMSAQIVPTPPPGLAEAGQAALKKFLPALDGPEMKQRHGFAPDDDLSAVSLGPAFSPRLLTAEAIAKHAEGAALEGALIDSREWFFPVLSKGRRACLLTVLHRDDGSLVADKFGMAHLAQGWAAVNEAWPAVRGYTPWLVLVPMPDRVFFTVPQAKPANLTPLPAGPETPTAENFEKLAAAEQALARLRQQLSPAR